MTIKTELCGYGCGKPWRRWKGTKLVGHAKCALSPKGQDAILRRLESPHVTVAQIAAEHGVTTSVVNAWVAAARKRRGR